MQTGVDWFEGVPEKEHRYCAFNGGLGEDQMAWLKDSLATARDDKKSVIVLNTFYTKTFKFLDVQLINDL